MVDINADFRQWLKFFHKRTSNTNKGTGINSENKELAKKLHKPIIRKFEKRKVHSSFIDNIWGTDLADKQLSKFNKEVCFSLCAIDIYSKYAWVVPLRGKNGVTITNTFQKILDESGCKPNKIWVDKGSEFDNRFMKSWFEDKGIEVYSANNEWKPIVAERFIRTLNNRIYKDMISVPKTLYTDELDDTGNKYYSANHGNIIIKPVDVKSSSYISFDKKSNKGDPKSEIGDHVSVS